MGLNYKELSKRSTEMRVAAEQLIELQKKMPHVYTPEYILEFLLEEYNRLELFKRLETAHAD